MGRSRGRRGSKLLSTKRRRSVQRRRRRNVALNTNSDTNSNQNNDDESPQVHIRPISLIEQMELTTVRNAETPKESETEKNDDIDEDDNDLTIWQKAYQIKTKLNDIMIEKKQIQKMLEIALGKMEDIKLEEKR